MAAEGKKVIDVHTHVFGSLDFFPPAWQEHIFAGKFQQFMSTLGDEAKARKAVEEYKESLNVLGTYDALIKDMDEAGVDISVVSPLDYRFIYGQEARVSIWEINEYVAEAQKKYPDRIIGFAGIDPLRENAVELLERAVTELGLKGIKIYPASFSPQDERVQKFFEKVNELEIVALFHQGAMYRPAFIGNLSPVHLDALSIKYPRMKMIAAHVAKGWEEVLINLIVYREDSIATDISGFQYYELGKSPWHFLMQMRYMMDKIPRSVLMGSDWPFNKGAPYISHKEWFDAIRNLKIPDPVLQLEIGIKDFSEEEKDMILGKNASRFLGI